SSLRTHRHIIYSVVLVSEFFFFQAEDGIRDYKVTGVQTCALPICRTGSMPAGRAPTIGRAVSGVLSASMPVATTEIRIRPASFRSEERRVGKSVDLGGRRIIKKKNDRKQ